MINPVEAGKLGVIADRPECSDKQAHKIVAAGPLSKQPGSTAYRIVLCVYDDGSFSVHFENFADVTDLEKSYLANGSYYKGGPEGLVKATKEFAKRVAGHADYLASIYREDKVEQFLDKVMPTIG